MFDFDFSGLDVLNFTDEELEKIATIGGIEGYMAVFEDRLKTPKPEVKQKDDYMAGGGFEFL